MRIKIVLSAFLIFTTTSLFAQTINQNTGWFLFLNSTKFNDKWGMHFDLQLRSEDKWDGLRNLLVRPGVTYYINKNSNATLGYLFTQTYLPNDILVGAASLKNTLTEHRIWQQYIYSHQPWKGAALSHRFRLEQRFIERQTDDLFSQRLRYFFRLIQPLQKQEGAFTKGVFAALQNELFFNIQNKEKVNGSLFDQNRAYLAVGYRVSKGFDVEAGYLNQSINGASRNTVNNVAQLALYTRF
ncbi:DUF2490 domain-containing protein [Pedobacter sp. SL55]|uniref:DUF2490 domain-containing protein n=1 Tax=Pedobacter sp. SL55 TaxID=2995161 RepID=UPI002270A463|nr:DUF2490 domain-containing protein [Pedobacter sp. SL55]WAC41102.1 DUF2490 domain-containing protein [Pedobacter sp. SL55]